MRPHARALWISALATGIAACGAGDADPGAQADPNWPSFRGAFARGTSDGYPLPTTWDVEGGDDLRWRTELPGLAHSSPVIWGDMIFLTTAVADEEPVLKVSKGDEEKRASYGWIKSLPEEGPQQFQVLCVDKRDGSLRWTRTAHEGVPFSKRHPNGTHANPSPAADAEHVVAYFGAEGLYCYDHAGELLWELDLGDLVAGYYVNPTIQWGIASSPVIHEGRVIVLCDVLDDPFVAAFDVENGEELWRTARMDVPTWCTPTVYPGEERTQIIVNGYDTIAGYDFDTGAEIWTMVGGGAVPIPTAVAAHGLFFITSAGGMPGGRGAPAMRAPIFAVRAADAVGIVTIDNHVAWHKTRGGNYIPSPLVYGDELYCATSSILTCYDARTGEEHYRRRVGSPIASFSASPVAGDGKVYLTKDDGTVHVLKAGPEYEVLAENTLGEVCMASPAISEGVLYFRTRSHLMAISAVAPER
jgi:outer membrane protein assembly factor BamB